MPTGFYITIDSKNNCSVKLTETDLNPIFNFFVRRIFHLCVVTFEYINRRSYRSRQMIFCEVRKIFVQIFPGGGWLWTTSVTVCCKPHESEQPQPRVGRTDSRCIRK